MVCKTLAIRKAGISRSRSATEGRSDRAGEIAAEFVRRKVDVIVTAGTTAVAVKEALAFGSAPALRLTHCAVAQHGSALLPVPARGGELCWAKSS